MNAVASRMAGLAVAWLLCGLPPAHATDVSTRPLKASVLVKPNMIIGMDDSASMDAETQFDTDNGFLFWQFFEDALPGWDNAGTLLGANGEPPTSLGLPYLFPGKDSDSERLLRSYHWVYGVPPTKQFAFARSSSFNPQYYDSLVTYDPWATAYYNGASHSFSNASATAAQSHPILGTTTMNLTTTYCGTDDGESFPLLEGMVADKGMHIGWPGCAQVLGADLAGVASNTQPMAYYPATFWVPAPCTVSTDDPNCARAPNGTTTLKRYEIKPGNSFPSGRSYAAEMQNFANWYQYYRKRRLSMAASVGRTLESLSGVRIGVVPFSAQSPVTMYDTDASAASSNYQAASATFYLSGKLAGTPTRSTLNYIGQQFATNTNIVQYACQRNYALIATDGYAGDSAASALPAYDPSAWGSGAPYATTQPGTLADIALAYYTANLRPSMATGRIPASDTDTNTNLHMNTYALSLGARGSLWPGSAAPAASPTPYAWPTVVFGPDGSNRKALDELWHATLNGRGQMYLATTPAITSSALQSAFDSMQAQMGGQASTSVSSVNLGRGDSQAYVAGYDVKGWAGDLGAYKISTSTGEVDSSALVWSATAKLATRDWTTRVIASSNGSTGKPFTTSDVGSLVNPGQAWGTTADVIAYLRGNRANEGTTWRARYSLLGAIINASPTVSSSDLVVYATSNEGMLHAFSAETGSELWAYVPYNGLASIGATTARTYRFRTQLDGQPTLGTTASGKKLLIGGRGTAGSGWYALNVADPTNITSDAALAARALWEFPNASTATSVKNTLGLAVGVPRIVRIKGSTGSSVALLSSGYNNTAQDGKGRLFVLDADTGAVKQTLVASTGTSVDPGFAQFSPFYEDDGSVQYVYGGDELGNLWRFDLVNNTVNRLAVLKDASGTAQPITTAPALTYYQGLRIVYVGTGRLLGLTDLSTTPTTQTMYAIADGTNLTNARSTLVEQTYNLDTDKLSSNGVDWTATRGWFIDLPAGELVNTVPSLAFNAVVFVTNKSTITGCSASSRYYVVDMRQGSPFTGVGYVGATISGSELSSRMVLLRTSSSSSSSSSSSASNQCGSGGVAGMTTTASGETLTKSLNLCQSIASQKNAWTEIRR